MNHIAVFYDIFFSFRANQPFLSRGAQISSALDQLIVTDRLRPDKALFKIRVDFAGGLGAELDELKALITAGVGTFVCMHMDADIVKALQEDNRCNVLCMGHMASDSIGFNQILDAWEARGVEVTRIGGLV